MRDQSTRVRNSLRKSLFVDVLGSISIYSRCCWFKASYIQSANQNQYYWLCKGQN